MLHLHHQANADAQISDYWDDFYASRSDTPDQPSDFAHWLADRLGEIDLLLEFGCGAGRDAIFFGKSKTRLVVATDASQAALTRLESRAEYLTLSNLITRQTSLALPASLSRLSHALDELRESFDGAVRTVFYSRFLLHAVSEDSQQNLFNFVATQARQGDVFAAEYRAADLETHQYVFGTHYRRPNDPDQVAQMCRNSGFTTVESFLSNDFAVYQSERPLVARTLARR
jgi:SAM-dependent methyltransferase